MRDEFEKLKALSEPWKAHMNKISQDIKDAQSLLVNIGAPSISIKIKGDEGTFYMTFVRKMLCVCASESHSFATPLIEMDFQRREFFHAYLGEYLLAVHQHIKERV